MSTRATYEFIDELESYTVYKHHDGYPECAYEWIAKSLEYAWQLPRFEASDFAAAFCAGNKDRGGGGIYLTKDRDSHLDTQFHYVISCAGGVILVDRYILQGAFSNNRKWTKEESGTLSAMLDNRVG